MKPTTPIVQLCRGQPELSVRLVQPGCNGGQLVDFQNIRLVIKPPRPCMCHKVMPLSPLYFHGCWPGHDTPWGPRVPPEERQLLVYPAFNITEQGDIVFRFDEQLWEYPSGRYEGHIELQDGTPITVLDIDLCNTPLLVESVSVVQPLCHMETCS